jgi:alpha-mannosidase
MFLAVLCFILGAQESQTPDYTKQKTLHCVATAHFDTQWLWTIQTSINEYLPATMYNNFKLFEKYPNYKFNFEGAFKYMLMKEYYPNEYAKVKEYIKQERWSICGSSLDAGDVNIPSPEAISRSILLGQNFFQKEFGTTSRDLFLPDCFGFGYTLPTIANFCGLKSFSTQKLQWGSSAGIPFDIGVWQGVDGSKIFAVLNASDYNSGIKTDLSTDANWIATVDNVGKKNSGQYFGYRYFGVGDRGGAPHDTDVYWLEKSIVGKGPLKIMSSSADLLAKQMTQPQLDLMPVYSSELLLSTHGTGSYTSQCAMKRWNRKNELLADAAEKASVLANWLGGTKYPREKLNSAWTRFLWHQFHDDIAGTSIPEAYSFSWNDELLSMNQFASILEDATGSVAQALDTKVKGIPLVIYNPVGIEREDVVEAEITFKETPKAVKVFNKEGKEIASQILEIQGNKAKFIFIASAPALGYEVYDVQLANKPSTFKNDLKITNSSIENSLFTIVFEPKTGDVKKITQKADKKELLVGPLHLSLFDNKSTAYPAWEIMYSTISAKPRGYVEKITNIEIIENGPVRASLKVTREKDGSVFTQIIQLTSGKAGERVTIKNLVNWNTKGTLLKAEFPLNCAASRATYDLGLGTIQRAGNTEKLYEVPAQQWVDLTAADNQFGITLITDSKNGWDKPNDNTLRLTLIHTPETGKNFAFQSMNDIGIHEFSYALYPHKLDWRKGKSPWVAACYNQPLLAFQTIGHEGKLGKSFSLANLNSQDVMIKSVKMAENTDEIVVHLQELIGTKIANVKLSFPGGIISAREVNGAEEPIGPARVDDGKIIFNLNAYQPKAFAIKVATAPAKVVSKTSIPVTINYTKDIVSFDSDRSNGDIDGSGHSIPAELFSSKLISDDVEFRLGSSENGQNNALECKGQVINIPQGSYNKVYVLATATKDSKGVFNVDSYSEELEVPYYSGFIGQWDSRSALNSMGDSIKGINDYSKLPIVPAYLKKVPVAWNATHCHNSKQNANDAYKYCYLFKLSLDIPKGAKTLTLPNNPDILVVAISVANDANANTKAAQLLVDDLKR